VVAADIIEHDGDTAVSSGLLEEGAWCECEVWDLPASEAAWWIAREARYRIACVLGVRPHDRDDPINGLIINALARHPTAVQARILRATAHGLPRTENAAPKDD
jgi:hypothetical protein